ncbi:MAG: PaaI family thioesterase [Hyphomicrobiaceae bacterium]
MTEPRLNAEGRPVPPQLDTIRWMAARNPVFQWLGCEIVEASHGRTRLAMPITEKVSNTFGAMHGGLIFAFADLCFGFTANAAENIMGVSASGEIHWLAPGIIGDRLIGEASQVWRKGRNGLYDVKMWNETQGDVVAIVHGRMRFLGGPVISQP